MLDIKNIDIKIDNAVFQKIIGFLKQTWLGIPGWLRSVLIVTVIAGGMYYLYNRIVISYDIEDLTTEVNTLNSRYDTTVFYDRYVYDINNVLTTVKTLEMQMNVIFNEQMSCMDAFSEFVRANKPGDPILQTLQHKKQYLQQEFNAYKNIIEHQIDVYENNDEILQKKEQSNK